MDVRKLKPDDAQWEKYILKDRNADFLQSPGWARMLEQTHGHKSYLLEIMDTGETVGYFAVFITTGKKNISITVYNGPAVLQPDKTSEMILALVDWLDDFSSKRKIQGIKLTFLKYNWSDAGSQQIIDRLIARGYEHKTWGTYLVDLDQSEEDLWMYVKKSARKSLKKVRGSDAIVKKIENFDEYMEKFIRPYNQMEKEFDRSGISDSQAEKSRNLDFINKHYHFYYAEYQGQVQGVIGMYVFNGIAAEIMSSASRFSQENKIYVQDLLHWHMFLDAKNMGCHTFDLSGVNPEPDNPKEKGINQFKKKWGGQYVEYPIFEKQDNSIISKVMTKSGAVINKIRGG